MKVFGNYGQYYNLIYEDKDYASEVDYIESLIRKNAPHARTILDLGCGTGPQTVEEVLRAALYGETDVLSEAEAGSGSDKLILGERCVFPLIKGECGPAMRDLPSERLDQILEEEDIERAVHPRRR